MKIDLTCPVELWQYAMPTEDDAECTLIMNNLSDKVVVSVQVTLACFDGADELLFRQTERIQGLKAGVGERFSIMLLPSEWRGVEGVDLIIEKVWFDDATVWRKGNAPLTHYRPNNLQAGRALDELRFVAGKDAVGYPQVQPEVWLCVCGRANAIESDRCCRCERRRDAVFASFSPSNVAHVIAAHEQKLDQAARKAREENAALQEKREKLRLAKRRRRKQALRLTLSALCLAALITVVLVWVLPTLRYNAALRRLKAGDYQQARAAFVEMGTYRDAARQAKECDYREALDALERGDEESLLVAEAAFETLGDFSDSAEYRNAAAYALGCTYLNARAYESAADKFQQLGDYRDSADKLKQATYQQACALLESGNPVVARVLFSGIADYLDAADKIPACTYAQAKALLENGDPAGAVDLLAALGDYEDAGELMQEANYRMAEEKLNEGDSEAAGELYLAAGDYGDAQAKANDALYRLAMEKKAAGAFDEAIALFERIPAYLDSEGQAADCRYLQAKAKKESGDLEGALALLQVDGMPQNEQAKELYQQCAYELAVSATEGGDPERAEMLLENIQDYQDSKRRLRLVRYELAEAALENGDYAAARERYDALGDYRDSVAKRKQCDYAIATAALNAGDYAAAISGFEALGNYKDSKTVLEEAAYRQALGLKAAGDRRGAMAALEAMAGSERAQNELNALAMEEAKQLADAGDMDGAAAAYDLIDTAEAKEQANAIRYAQAAKLRDEGALPEAGAAFAQLGTYGDAAAQSKACYDACYGSAAATARTAMREENYAAVIAAVQEVVQEPLPKAYADLSELYREACYRYAEQLYDAGAPYQALPYYRSAGDYRDAATKKLERRAYLILGEWTSTTGKTAVFRADGTCDLLGETLHFRVSGFSLYTGASAAEMTVTHKLSAIDKESMSLRDIRNGQDVVYKFERVGEWTLPDIEPEPLPVPESALAPAATEPPSESDELLITEETDEQP